MPDDNRSRRSDVLIHEYLKRLQKNDGDARLKYRPPTSVVRSETYSSWWDGVAIKPRSGKLKDYTDWLDEARPAPGGKRWLELFSLNIDEFERIILSTRAVAQGVEFAEVGPSKIDEVARAKTRAIAGLYQLIRPFVGDASRIILEPMSICDVAGMAHVYMYSHQQKMTERKYVGNLHFSSLYASAFLLRRHESGTGHAMRSISLFVDYRERAGNFEQRDCFSGIMLRGTSGKAVPRMITAVPFVAIRVSDPDSLDQIQFEKSRTKVVRAVTDACAFAGELHERDGLVFSEPKFILSKVYPTTNEDQIVRTVLPTYLSDLITGTFAKPSPLAWWMDLCKTHLVGPKVGEASPE